jgi:hypothetical protein
MQKASTRWSKLTVRFKTQIGSGQFCQSHRRRDRDFTRDRLLTFPVVVLLLLQKTTRSIQRHAHSFLRQLWPEKGALSVSAGGWTLARAKLRHTAFIELNEQILLPEFYSPDHHEHCQKWHGHRVLGVDGSTLRLPSHSEIDQEFGVSIAVNGHDNPAKYRLARLSVLYDLLNDLGLNAQMAPQSASEKDMAVSQLKHVRQGDVLIWDRGYTGFFLMAQARAHGAHFIGRCSNQSFFTAQQMFKLNRAGHSLTVKQIASPEQKRNLRDLNLPTEMVVRFVSVRLPNGDLEVLVTSLLDQTLYPTEEFLEVYHWRWNHETYHQMLKSRLDLENWTGQTLEAVKQDLHAAVFLSNLESLLSQEVQEQLSHGDAERKHPIAVNRAVSYHAVKERLLDLLFKDVPVDQTIIEIQAWMRRNPVTLRKRRIPRPKTSLHRSYNYQRNIKKSVF